LRYFPFLRGKLWAVSESNDPPIEIVPLPPHRLDELEALWAALYEHQGSLTPHLDARTQPLSDSWRERRELERRWLAQEPSSFVLGAELAGRMVGYAFVRINTGDIAVSWSISNPHADLSTLSVAPELRGRGIGTMLMDAVEVELKRLGVCDLTISVITTNSEAARFYERRGAVPFTTVFLQDVSASISASF
jgi:ribosomal protein S18 acetylase RimI-like enzyme